jgi:hypothetical protein
MTIGGWYDGSWDTLVLAGIVMPGVWRVSGSVSRGVTIVKAKGTDGPRLKDDGQNAGTLTIEGDVWTDRGGQDTSRLVALEQFLATIQPRQPGGLKTPVTILHPAASLLGISTIQIPGFSVRTIANGRLGIAFDNVTEWFPEEDAGKPTQPGTTGDGGPLDDGTVPAADPENLGMDTA